MKVLLVAATKLEIQPTIEWLDTHFKTEDGIHFDTPNLSVVTLVTGVGMVATTYALTKVIAIEQPNLVLHVGIAGAINKTLQIGDVVQVKQEYFGDVGAEDAKGTFISVFDMQLLGTNTPPFVGSVLPNYSADAYQFLPAVKGVTVNKVTGTQQSIDALMVHTNADIETMENAAFFFVCLQEDVPFLSIKAISNYVEPRNKDNWDIPLAVKQLNQTLQQILMLML